MSAIGDIPAIGDRHCEERNDEAIQPVTTILDCFASLAMTQFSEAGGGHPTARSSFV
jgi:hypothetical protein